MTRHQAIIAHKAARRRGDTRAMHRTWIAARRATADELRAHLRRPWWERVKRALAGAVAS